LGAGELSRVGPENRNPAGYLVRFPISAFAESTRVLRSAIRHGRGNEQRIAVLAVASALPAEGKTSVSLCLARSAAMAGQKVLLIDCDLRRHSVQKFVGVEPAVGITDALVEGADWRACVVADPATSAKMMLVRSNDTVSAELFGSPAMTHLLSEARQEYDLVILDCPPILAVAEARSLAEMADATVLIVKSGKAPARAVRAAVRQLDDAGAQVLGIVLNAINPRVAGRFSYGDALYYSRAQDYYFANDARPNQRSA
jgi:polysaccharide biosynthesis transport protein